MGILGSMADVTSGADKAISKPLAGAGQGLASLVAQPNRPLGSGQMSVDNSSNGAVYGNMLGTGITAGLASRLGRGAMDNSMNNYAILGGASLI